jgi:hypothetical protein
VVVGSLLAGQRYMTERCGDGVAIASAHHAATVLGPRATTATEPGQAVPARTEPDGRRQRAGTRR